METCYVVVWKTWNHFTHFLSMFTHHFLWRAIHMMFGFNPPWNTNTYLVNDILKKIKLFNPFYAGVAAILWSIWIIGNKVIFDNCQLKSLLQVQFKGSTGFGSDPTATVWGSTSAHGRGLSQKKVGACRTLETTAMRLFAPYGLPSLFLMALQGLGPAWF